MTTAMVLAAGFGTRLRPLTELRPKPLVPLGDRPLLAHIVEALNAAGVERLVVNAHHDHGKIVSYLRDVKPSIQVSIEPSILGTAGGIQRAREFFDGAPVVVHNGDIVTRAPTEELLAYAGDGLCLAVSPRAIHEGSVGLDAQGNVVRLRGKVFGAEARGGDYVGIAALGARCLSTLPEAGCLVQDWALPELEAGGVIASVAHTRTWTDIGSLQAYLRANLAWLGERLHHVGPGARIASSVRLDRCVVGQGAVVDGVGELEQCVVWPGATATAPLSRTVVMSNGQRVAIEADE